MAEEITLEVHICDQCRSYLATFPTEESALEFIERKSATHAFFEVDSAPIPDQYTRLLDTLRPTCEHGLSASLCRGPAHYATAEEIAMGY